jgi:hypothetical protein
MTSRKLGQWRPLNANDRRLIGKLGVALAEFKREQLSDKHLSQAQHLLCSRYGPLANRIVGTDRVIDLDALVG